MMKVIVIALFCIAAIAAQDNKEESRLLNENENVVKNNEACLKDAKSPEERSTCFTDSLNEFNTGVLPVEEQKTTKEIIEFAKTSIVECNDNDGNTAECIVKAAKETENKEIAELAEIIQTLFEVKAEMENAEKAQEKYFNERYICSKEQEGEKRNCVLTDLGLEEETIATKKYVKSFYTGEEGEFETYFKNNVEPITKEKGVVFTDEFKKIIDQKRQEEVLAFQKEVAAYQEKQAQLVTCTKEGAKETCVLNKEGMKVERKRAEAYVKEAYLAFATDLEKTSVKFDDEFYNKYFTVSEEGVKYTGDLLLKDYETKQIKDFHNAYAKKIEDENAKIVDVSEKDTTKVSSDGQ